MPAARVPTTATAAKPAAHVASSRPMTDAQFEKVRMDLSLHGTETELSSQISSAFGLTARGQSLTVHQDAYLDAAKNAHGFIALPNGNYLFGYIERYASHLYYVDRRLSLIASLIDAKQDGAEKIVMLSDSAGRLGLAVELQFFANLSSCPEFKC
jgi:hypothetical protein